MIETEQARPALSAAEIQKADDDLGWWLEFGTAGEATDIATETSAPL